MTSKGTKGVWDGKCEPRRITLRFTNKDNIAAADRKLLLGILEMHSASVDNEAMAKYMSTSGYTFTASAIQNRMKRLKKMAKERFVPLQPPTLDSLMILAIALLRKMEVRQSRKLAAVSVALLLLPMVRLPAKRARPPRARHEPRAPRTAMTRRQRRRT